MLPAGLQTERITNIAVERSWKVSVTAGVLLHLVFIGITGASTVTLFGVASISFLDTGRKPMTASRIDDRVPPRSDPNAGRVLARETAATPETEEMLPAFVPQAALAGESAAVIGINPISERLSTEHDLGNTTEVLDTARDQDPFSRATHSTEVNRAEQMPAEPLPVAEAIVMPDVAGTLPTAINPAEEPGQTFGVEIQRNEPLAPRQRSPDVRNRPFHRHAMSANAELRNRVQKECGSIIFPALRRHCVATFRIQYR